MNLYQRKTLEDLNRIVDLRLERCHEELSASNKTSMEAVLDCDYHTHAYERGFQIGILQAILSLEITQSRLNDILEAYAEADAETD